MEGTSNHIAATHYFAHVYAIEFYSLFVHSLSTSEIPAPGLTKTGPSPNSKQRSQTKNSYYFRTFCRSISVHTPVFCFFMIPAHSPGDGHTRVLMSISLSTTAQAHQGLARTLKQWSRCISFFIQAAVLEDTKGKGKGSTIAKERK